MDANKLKKIPELFDPVVKFVSDEIANPFCKPIIIQKLQETVFWIEKAINENESNLAAEKKDDANTATTT